MLFIVAETQEAKHLIEYYKMKDEGLKSLNLWSNSDLQLIITGAGLNNVINSLSIASYLRILTPQSDVINVGYAGAKGIDIGEVVCVKACRCLEFPTKAKTWVENCVRLCLKGYDCYTSFDFVEKDNGIVGSALFDMELAYIARFPYRTLQSIKIVSGNLYYDGFKEFNGEEAWKKAIMMIQERRVSYVSRYIAP